jgi:DNA mismatch repair protein MutL
LPEKGDFIRREWAARIISPAPVAGPGNAASFSPPTAASEPRSARPFVWQLHQKYILTQIKSGLIIVDQHVAHERILFERAMSDFEKKSPVSQQLLFPEVIELAPEDHSYFLEILPFLEKIGYQIKIFSGRSFSIEAVPAGVKHAADEKVLLEILDEYQKSRGEHYDIREKVATSFSCKTAIKAGERLTPEEMLALIERLFETKTPYFCPHGRPVIINISLEELDRRFGRIK